MRRVSNEHTSKRLTMKEAMLFQIRPSVICAITFLLGASLVGCNQPFDPRGPLYSQVTIFSVLSTDRNDQFVRVERTYMPTDFDALAYTADNFVPNALVTIQGTDSTFTLRDTTIARPDMSRYKFSIRAYFAKPLVINYGASYHVTVRSPQFENASTAIVVPAKPVVVMTPLSSQILQFPRPETDKTEIVFTIDLGGGAKGWIGRLFVYYNVLKDGKWVEERAPVPIYFIFPKVFTSVVYRELTRAGYKNRSASVYLNNMYARTINQVAYEKYPSSKITFTRAVFELVQVEENLYNYYEVAHGNNDPHSVRLDEPLYTNLVGGVGVVGAYTLDSLVQILPDNFIANRQ